MGPSSTSARLSSTFLANAGFVFFFFFWQVMWRIYHSWLPRRIILASRCSAFRIIAMVWLQIPHALPTKRRLLGNSVSSRGIQDLLEFHPLNSILLWERPAATVLHEHRPRLSLVGAIHMALVAGSPRFKFCCYTISNPLKESYCTSQTECIVPCCNAFWGRK
jgi:hypothetical protein